VPFATAPDGARIHYARLGRPGAAPVLMIQGLGADKHLWTLQRLGFAPWYQTVALDNRGAGRSDKPTTPYSLEQMADDAVAVLDHAGIESAHVMGASMGGAISQVFAMRHPERVRSLVLACTACRHHEWRRQLLQEWADRAGESGMRDMSRGAMRWVIGPRSLRRFAPALGWLGPLAFQRPAHAFASQVAAILGADTEAVAAELAEIRVPTLVVVGNQDVLTPRGDSEELAELIPGAELVVISGAAHGLMMEHFASFNQVVLEFLARASKAG
jgi:3-oxoadipate enol-lactonase